MTSRRLSAKLLTPTGYGMPIKMRFQLKPSTPPRRKSSSPPSPPKVQASSPARNSSPAKKSSPARKSSPAKKSTAVRRKSAVPKVKPHELPPLPSLPKGNLQNVTYVGDDMEGPEFGSDEYLGKTDRVKRYILSLSKLELLPLVKGLTRMPDIKSLHTKKDFRPMFEWVNKYPAWYLRKRLYAQTIRKWLADIMYRQAQEERYERGDYDIKKKVYEPEKDGKFMAKFRNWAPPLLDKRIRDSWELLTKNNFTDWRILTAPHKPYNGWLATSTFYQIARPVAPGYEEWSNPALDDKDAETEGNVMMYVHQEQVQLNQHALEEQEADVVQMEQVRQLSVEIDDLIEDIAFVMAGEPRDDDASVQRAAKHLRAMLGDHVAHVTEHDKRRAYTRATEIIGRRAMDRLANIYNITKQALVENTASNYTNASWESMINQIANTKIKNY